MFEIMTLKVEQVIFDSQDNTGAMLMNQNIISNFVFI